MSGASVSARFGAVSLIHGVLMDHRMLGDLLADPKGPLENLSGPDRARAQTLAATTLRHMPQLDQVLDGMIEKKPPLRALNALRVCAAEILVDGIAAHGAVNAAVEIVRASPKTRTLGGMVNAVGRKLGALDASALKDIEPPKLPKALRGAFVKSYGEEATVAMEAVHTQRPPVDLTLRVPADAPYWAKRLGAEVLPTGSLRLAQPGQISALDGYEAGKWWVQDTAAAMPVRLFEGLKGKRVLDLCAAPGGKTLQLAALGAEVTALDVSDARMERVRENLTRARLSAELVVADALTWEPDQPFDAILLDAPCSATGTIRRHPDLPYVRPSLDLKPILEVQAALLRRSSAWLKPGGQIVYAVCSLIGAEGERQIERLLADDPSMSVDPVDVEPLGLDPDWQNPTKGLRLRPDYWASLGGMDGFFAARLRKQARVC